jgi:pimeloyl-ACP methyl ester carboxylesterase
MSNNLDTRPSCPLVIALHCSGASGSQWRHLAGALGERFTVVAPDLFGSAARGHWKGERAFTLSEEAAHAVDTIDAHDGPAHLVGHSFGGGVALHVACKRPTRIASLSLYEPTAFHVLKAAGPDGRSALKEIGALVRAFDHGVLSGAYRAVGERFVDYWNGPGAWARLKPEAQAEFIRYAPKGCLDFRALLNQRPPLSPYRRLAMPALLMVGEHAPRPTRLIASTLADVMSSARLHTIAGAGHMGPFTHGEKVIAAIADHILTHQPKVQAARAPCARAAA